MKWYDEGMGTHWYDQFIGGAIGTGLEVNIIQGYEFLAKNYEGGDEVYVLGFSRGAYTARSLVGMVRNCGLVEAKHVALRVGIAYGIYRTRDDGPDSMTAKLFRSSFCREIQIKFIGVWDTVGALGIPHDIVKGLNMKFYEFHDTELSGSWKTPTTLQLLMSIARTMTFAFGIRSRSPDKLWSNGGSSAPTAMSAGAIRIGGFPISRSAGCKTRQAPLDWD